MAKRIRHKGVYNNIIKKIQYVQVPSSQLQKTAGHNDAGRWRAAASRRRRALASSTTNFKLQEKTFVGRPVVPFEGDYEKANKLISTFEQNEREVHQ